MATKRKHELGGTEINDEVDIKPVVSLEAKVVSVLCSSIWVGTHVMLDLDNQSVHSSVIMENSGIHFKMPHCVTGRCVDVMIPTSDIITYTGTFAHDALPFASVYITAKVGQTIRYLLGMDKGRDSKGWFDPSSLLPAEKNILFFMRTGNEVFKALPVRDNPPIIPTFIDPENAKLRLREIILSFNSSSIATRTSSYKKVVTHCGLTPPSQPRQMELIATPRFPPGISIHPIQLPFQNFARPQNPVPFQFQVPRPPRMPQQQNQNQRPNVNFQGPPASKAPRMQAQPQPPKLHNYQDQRVKPGLPMQPNYVPKFNGLQNVAGNQSKNPGWKQPTSVSNDGAILSKARCAKKAIESRLHRRKQIMCAEVFCRSIRVGTFKTIHLENQPWDNFRAFMTYDGISFRMQHCVKKNNFAEIIIPRDSLLYCCTRVMKPEAPYITVRIGHLNAGFIRDQVGMVEKNKGQGWFDPSSINPEERNITFALANYTTDLANVLVHIFGEKII